MTSEASFIAALRKIAKSPAARGLADDAAVLDFGGSRLILTMDAIVEGIHFLPTDPPATIAWKLVATNVSDLAAKGAEPRGCLLTYPLATDPEWDRSFLTGLSEACRRYAIPLLGGDTVRQPIGSARSFALVALGEPTVGVPVPSRSGAKPGHLLWVSAPIGDAGLGLALLQGERHADPDSFDALVASYHCPAPNIQLGVALAPLVSAMMDVSDGLMIDIQRLAAASGAAAILDLDRVPLSFAYSRTAGTGRADRMFAIGAGDDYCLLLTAPASSKDSLTKAADSCGGTLYQVGHIQEGAGMTILSGGEPIPLPTRLGFEH